MNDSAAQKRCRLRFGIRSLLLIPVCFATYFALGKPTETLGVRDVSHRLTRDNSGNFPEVVCKAPLLLEAPVNRVDVKTGQPAELITESSYYVWCFGLVAKVPYTRERRRYLPPLDAPVAVVAPRADSSGSVMAPQNVDLQ